MSCQQKQEHYRNLPQECKTLTTRFHGNAVHELNSPQRSNHPKNTALDVSSSCVRMWAETNGASYRNTTGRQSLPSLGQCMPTTKLPKRLPGGHPHAFCKLTTHHPRCAYCRDPRHVLSQKLEMSLAIVPGIGHEEHNMKTANACAPNINTS